MTEFGRLEYMTPAGWVVGHAGISLQDPARYVEILSKARVVAGAAKQGVTARFVPIDGEWRAGTPVLPATVPLFHEARGVVPVDRITECAACGAPHTRGFECLL